MTANTKSKYCNNYKLSLQDMGLNAENDGDDDGNDETESHKFFICNANFSP